MGLFKRFRKKSPVPEVLKGDPLVKPEDDVKVLPQDDALSVAQDNVGADLRVRPDEQKQGFFKRLKQGLTKTRQQLGGVGLLLRGKKTVDEDVLDELEMTLLTADMGVNLVEQIIGELTTELGRKDLKDGDAVFDALKTKLEARLNPVAQPLSLADHKPNVILFVGVNGAGKTTTIGKLAKQLQNEGKSVMLAAGDTFRAAAVEQLQVWGERNNIPVVAQKTGADSAAVIFDAYQSAKAKNMDVLIADTAGRLHTQSHLLEELKKVVRVLQKQDPNLPHEVMLVIDANMGQNALMQAKQFDKAVKLTGMTLTKLDGTAKGGIIFSIADELNVPIRFIGVGEQIDDLAVFDAKAFVEAVLA